MQAGIPGSIDGRIGADGNEEARYLNSLQTRSCPEVGDLFAWVQACPDRRDPVITDHVHRCEAFVAVVAAAARGSSRLRRSGIRRLTEHRKMLRHFPISLTEALDCAVEERRQAKRQQRIEAALLCLAVTVGLLILLA